MSQEGIPLSAAKAKKLYNAKGYVARSWPKAKIQLELYPVLLGTILGPTHQLVTDYLAAVKRYQMARIKLNNVVDREVGDKLGPALFVFYFQLLVRG